MALGRGRQQLARDPLVDLHRRRHQGLRQIFQGRNDRLQEAPEDGLEDAVEGAGGQRREPNHREVPQQARGNLVPTPAGGSARSDEDDVLDALEEQLLGVVEPTRVYRLPEQLVGGLGAIDLWTFVVAYDVGAADVAGTFDQLRVVYDLAFILFARKRWAPFALALLRIISLSKERC